LFSFFHIAIFSGFILRASGDFVDRALGREKKTDPRNHANGHEAQWANEFLFQQSARYNVAQSRNHQALNVGGKLCSSAL
jgi:hypothetical protein